jgi:AraC-like DNA-binding protein
LSLATVSIYLFISPDILYGFRPEKRFHTPVTAKSEPTSKVQVNTEVETQVQQLQPSTFQSSQTVENEVSNQDELDEKEEQEEIAAELAIVVNHMKESKPYLQQGYTIQDLSQQTEITVYQLSPLINGHFKMNFANWINKYRIEYVIEQVPENPQLTLEALSKKAGFISRSTFINAFKKEKGTTPREYFKELKLTT